MFKICLAAIVLLGMGFFFFPRFHTGLLLLVPFAPLAACLLMCPLMMYFGMRGNRDKGDTMNK